MLNLKHFKYTIEIDLKLPSTHLMIIAQLAGAVEYTDWTSAGSWYDTKQSDGEVPVILEHWGMKFTPSLLPDSLWSGVEAPERVQSMGLIESNPGFKSLLFLQLNCLLMLNGIVRLRIVLILTVCKQKNYIYTKWKCLN